MPDEPFVIIGATCRGKAHAFEGCWHEQVSLRFHLHEHYSVPYVKLLQLARGEKPTNACINVHTVRKHNVRP